MFKMLRAKFGGRGNGPVSLALNTNTASADLEANNNDDNESSRLVKKTKARSEYGPLAFDRIRGHKPWPVGVRIFQEIESALTALLGQHFLGTMSSTLWKEITEGKHAGFETQDYVTYTIATVVCQLVPTIFSYNNSLAFHERAYETLADSSCFRNSHLRTPIRPGHFFRILWGLVSALPGSYAAYKIFFQNADFPLVTQIPLWFRIVLTVETALSAVKTNTNNIIQVSVEDYLERRYLRNLLNLVLREFLFSKLRRAYPDRMVWLVARIQQVIDKPKNAGFTELDACKLILLLMQELLIKNEKLQDLSIITAPPTSSIKTYVTQVLGGFVASYGYAQSFACAQAMIGDTYYLPFGVVIMGANLSVNAKINGSVMERAFDLLRKWRSEFSWDEIGKREVGQFILGLLGLLCNVTIVCMLTYFFPVFKIEVLMAVQMAISILLASSMSVASIYTRINARNLTKERQQYLPKVGDSYKFVADYQQVSPAISDLERSRILTFCEREMEVKVKTLLKVVDDSTPAQLREIMPDKLFTLLPKTDIEANNVRGYFSPRRQSSAIQVSAPNLETNTDRRGRGSNRQQFRNDYAEFFRDLGSVKSEGEELVRRGESIRTGSVDVIYNQ